MTLRKILIMFDLDEIRLSRSLARAIEEELRKGTVLPDEVVKAYNRLYELYQVQMNRELS